MWARLGCLIYLSSVVVLVIFVFLSVWLLTGKGKESDDEGCREDWFGSRQGMNRLREGWGRSCKRGW